jgi:hypothetical protein
VTIACKNVEVNVLILRLSRVIIVSILIAALTACGGSSVPTASSGATSARATVDAPAGHFRSLHAFGSGSDGTNPYGGLVQFNGSLYGGTESGGANGSEQFIV